MLDDAADAEGVIEGLDGVADVEPLPLAAWRSSMIMSNGAGTAARYEDEGAKRVVAREVDAEDVLDRAGGVELDVDRRDDLNMGELAEDIADANVGGGGAGVHQRGGGAGMHDHVPADAVLLLAAAVEDAEHDGGDREDHDDLDRDSKGADDGAQGTMDEIAEDEFIH